MSRPILQSKSNAGITTHLRNHAQSPVQTTVETNGHGASQPILNHPNPQFRQHAQSPIQTTIGTIGHGPSQPICENQRNLRFRQHAQSPIQTTIGTKRRGASQPIRAITPIRGSDNTRNPRYRQPSGQSGGASRPIRAITPIRGSDNTRNPDTDNHRDNTAQGITAHLRNPRFRQHAQSRFRQPSR